MRLDFHFAIPGKAGIQDVSTFLDPGLRRGDVPRRLPDPRRSMSGARYEELETPQRIFLYTANEIYKPGAFRFEGVPNLDLPNISMIYIN